MRGMQKSAVATRLPCCVVITFVLSNILACDRTPPESNRSNAISKETDTDTASPASDPSNGTEDQPFKPPRIEPVSGFNEEYVKELEALPQTEVDQLISGMLTSPRLKYLAAMCYNHGCHLPIDTQRAAALLLEAGREGWPDACITLAAGFREGRLFTKDAVNEKIWLREAAQNGSSDAAFRLSMFYRTARRNDYLAWLYTAAEMGHKEAQHQLIRTIAESHDPLDVDSDVKKWANDWLREEATVEAHYVLGKLGEDAEVHFEYGATRNHIPSIFAMAQVLLLQYPNKDRRTDAFALLERAAARNDGRAMMMLAEIHYLGLFQQNRSTETAEKWLRNAENVAEQSPRLQASIGNFYRNLLRNRDEALRFYRSASRAGITDAQIALIEILAENQSTHTEARTLAEVLHREGVEAGTIALAKLLIVNPTNSTLRPEPQLYTLACSGSVPAQLTLAKYHLVEIKGQKPEPTCDPFEATRWLMVLLNTPKVEIKHPLEWYEAVSLLANCYEQGLGVPQDTNSAKSLRSTISGITLRTLSTHKPNETQK